MKNKCQLPQGAGKWFVESRHEHYYATSWPQNPRHGYRNFATILFEIICWGPIGPHGISWDYHQNSLRYGRDVSGIIQTSVDFLLGRPHHSEMCRNWGPGGSPFLDAAGSGGVELAELGEKLGRNCLYLDHLGSSWITPHRVLSADCFWA